MFLLSTVQCIVYCIQYTRYWRCLNKQKRICRKPRLPSFEIKKLIFSSSSEPQLTAQTLIFLSTLDQTAWEKPVHEISAYKWDTSVHNYRCHTYKVKCTMYNVQYTQCTMYTENMNQTKPNICVLAG